MIARRFLYVQPLGDELPDEDVTLVKTALESLIGWSVKVLAARTCRRTRGTRRAGAIAPTSCSIFSTDGCPPTGCASWA